MKVGFYLANISIKGGGIYTYANALLKLLIDTNSITKIVVLHSPEQKDYLNKLSTANKKIELVIVNIEESFFKKKILEFSKLFWLNRVISKYKLPGIMDRISQLLNPYYHLFKRLDVDLIHIPVQVSPVYGINKPIIVTLHDLQDIHFPEFFTPEHRIERSIYLYRSANLADKVLVSFNHIREDIVKFFNQNENKVVVFPLPLTKYWNTRLEQKPDEKIIKKFKIGYEYILYPAITWKHKNHITLIKALKLLKEKGVSIKLICSGGQNEYYNFLENEIIQHNLQDDVKFIGIVSEEELFNLYKFSRLVVIPSLYEAGSGPLIEAIWLGLPVICSNVTSLPKTIGDERFIFDPLNAEKLADLISRILTDKSFLEENIKNSINRKEAFEKIRIKEQLISTYNEILSKQNNNK